MATQKKHKKKHKSEKAGKEEHHLEPDSREVADEHVSESKEKEKKKKKKKHKNNDKEE